jgi:hypothetical protein
MQGAPIFGKVELWYKDGNSIVKSEYIDSGMVITGNYLIIVENEISDAENTVTSTGTLFNLSDVVRYKTHAK